MLERYVVHVTKACNMDCFYCYEQDKTSQYTKEEVLATVEQIAANCKDEKFGIEFLGGEPLMAFDIVKAVYEYLEENYSGRVEDYVITTNGSILTDEIMEFIKSNSKVVYAVSMDGTRWANQFRRFKNGQNTHEIVVENIKRAVKELPQPQVNVHVVTHPYNVGNLYNSVKYIYNLGIRSIGVGTVESTMDIDAMYCERFVKELAHVSEDIINGTFDGLFIDVLENQPRFNDVRTYIKDENGKVIGETYGRSEGDITSTDIFNSVQTTSKMGDVIVALRACVYENHQNAKGAMHD